MTATHPGRDLALSVFMLQAGQDWSELAVYESGGVVVAESLLPQHMGEPHRWMRVLQAALAPVCANAVDRVRIFLAARFFSDGYGDMAQLSAVPALVEFEVDTDGDVTITRFNYGLGDRGEVVWRDTDFIDTSRSGPGLWMERFVSEALPLFESPNPGWELMARTMAIEGLVTVVHSDQEGPGAGG